MMERSGRVTNSCIALILALTSVSAVQRLNSISDLKRIDFGPSVPKHSLVLLHWFANIVDIDDNGAIWLTFDPDSGYYGAHHYGNYEGMLDPVPWGYRYFTVGNLYQELSMQLPSYVHHSPVREYVGENRDRIIIRVQEQNRGDEVLQRIDQVYITQHEYQQRFYDIDHTYQITANLLREIRAFSVGENQQQLQHLRNRYGSNADIYDIRQTWGNLAGLGLLLFIVIQEKYSFNQQSYRPENNNRLENDSRPKNNNRLEKRQSPWHDGEASKTSQLIENRGSDSYDTSEDLNNTEVFVCCVFFFAFMLYVLYYLLRRFLFS